MSKRGKDTPILGAVSHDHGESNQHLRVQFHTSDLQTILNGTSDLQAYLVNFVNTLNPNIPKSGSRSRISFDLVDWPEYTSANKALLTALDANATQSIPSLAIARDDFRNEPIEFLGELSEMYPL